MTNQNKLIFLLLLGIAVYVPMLRAPFSFDDDFLIVRNPAIHHLSSGWEGIVSLWQFQPSRLLSNLTLALNFQFHQLDVLGYHIINVLIHLLTAMGVWFLVKQILIFRPVKDGGIDIAFWAGFLFLVHPLNTSAVSMTSQRSAEMVALFYIWSLVFYLRGRLLVAFGCGLLALLSKETGLTFPLAWMAADYFIRRQKPKLWVWAAFAGALFAVVLFFKFQVKALLFQEVISQSHRLDVLTAGTYLLTQLRVLVVFLKLIFLPMGQNVDYDFPMSHSLMEASTLLSFFLLSALIAWAVWARRHYWPLAMAVALFFISILPHLLPPRGNVIAEHKLYLSLSLIIPFLCYWLAVAVSKKQFIIILSPIIGIFALVTLQRNVLWADPVKMWEDTVKQSPNKARVYQNLGVAYFNAGRIEDALVNYKKAISLAPEMTVAYINIASIYTEQGRWSDAMDYVEQALHIDPALEGGYYQRAVLWALKKEDAKAIADFTKALALNGQLHVIYKLRGVLYERSGHQEEALADYSAWLAVNPEDIDILSKKADIYFRARKYKQALQEYNRLIALDPAPYRIYNRSVLIEILNKR